MAYQQLLLCCYAVDEKCVLKVQTVRNENKTNTIWFKILKTLHKWCSGLGILPKDGSHQVKKRMNRIKKEREGKRTKRKEKDKERNEKGG